MTLRLPEMSPTRRWLALSLAAALLWLHPSHAIEHGLIVQQDASPAAPGRIVPTVHVPLPVSLEQMWLVPAKSPAQVLSPLVNLAKGIHYLEDLQDAAAALPLVSNLALAETDVADYGRYYTGVALQRLNRLPEAEAALAAVAEKKPAGHLAEAALRRYGELLESKGDFARALTVYEQLLTSTTAPQSAWLQIGRMSELSGDTPRAFEAFRRVLYEYPLASESAQAEIALTRLNGFDLSSREAVARELARAGTLFGARRWAVARAALERVQPQVEGSDRDFVAVRLGIVDVMEGKHRAGRDTLRQYVTHPTLGVEAQFHVLNATRGLGERPEYRRLAREFADRHREHPLAEEALSDLATDYVRSDEDATGNDIFRLMLERFPAGRFAERAAWKAGWWAYRARDFKETVRIYEHGAATFPRSDYRPAWLYWTARAYDGLGENEKATERYRLTATDYFNLYYGRLAWAKLEERKQATVTPGLRRVALATDIPADAIERISRLIELEMYHPALAELRYTQTVHGDSPQIQATVAYVQHKLGNLRLAISAMKRAYPQYMAAGGERLPEDILRVIFPLDYWPLIQYHARAHDLDPFLVAALVGQESSFDPEIVSSAKAIGLMQVMPATGAQYARKIGVRPFAAHRLTEPEINVRIGTRYLGELIRRFGAAHYAIASYNAGEHRVERWKKETPDLPQDEFIDNIPYAETQNYVKRILGTAEDYRRLYGQGQPPSTITRAPGPRPLVADAPPPAPVTKTAPADGTVEKAPTKKTTTKKAPAKKTPPKKTAPKKTTGSAKKTPAKSSTKKQVPVKKQVPTKKR